MNGFRCPVLRLGVLVGLLSTSAFGFLKPDQQAAVNLYGYVQHFKWEESIDGDKLLEESGPIFGAGGKAVLRVHKQVLLEGLGEVFAGRVDYDGAIQSLVDGSTTPYESETTYTGVKIEGDLAVQVDAGHGFRVKPFAGMGMRAWERRLDDGDDDRRYGYDEDWVTLYAMLGLGVSARMGSHAEAYGSAALNVPVYNQVRYDFSNIGGPDDVEVEPGKKTSFNVEAGIVVRPVFVSVFYETLSFSESDLDDEYHAVFQPDSEAEMYGVKAGFSF